MQATKRLPNLLQRHAALTKLGRDFGQICRAYDAPCQYIPHPIRPRLIIGGEEVAGALSGARMSVANHAELVSYYAGAGSEPAAIEAMLRALPIELVPVDRELASAAGLLRAVTAEAGLSLGDRFCLALATREGVAALTADRAWKDVASACGVKVTVIR